MFLFDKAFFDGCGFMCEMSLLRTKIVVYVLIEFRLAVFDTIFPYLPWLKADLVQFTCCFI